MLLGELRGSYLITIALSALLACLSPSLAYCDGEPLDPGQINFRRDIGDTQDEYIDPYTGTLRLKYLDYSLAGNAGLDLEIYRIYSTQHAGASPSLPSTGTGDQATLWYYAPFGFGWDMHFGRMSKNDKFITVELGDGTQAELVRQTPGGDTWLSSEFWKLKYVLEGAVAQYTLYLPDGRKILFGQFSGDEYDELMGWRYATSIKKNNQEITVHYENSSNKRKITRVVDTLGRTVSFQYNNFNGTERLESLSRLSEINRKIHEIPPDIRHFSASLL